MPKPASDKSSAGTCSRKSISNERKTVLRITLAAFAVLILFSLAAAPVSAYSGGDGSVDKPYNISNPADLQQLATDVNGGTNYTGIFFEVTRDIDLSSVCSAASSTSWIPIGWYDSVINKTYSFNGTFDGGNHNISNLYISSSSKSLGLFGLTETGATIKNLGLKNVNVTGDDEGAGIGGLVGGNMDGTIENCYVAGNVIGDGERACVGGLVGVNQDGTIENCYVAGYFTGTGDNACVGGLVGYVTVSSVNAAIENCYVAGNVTCDGTGDYACVGGLVGDNYGTIENCYSTVNVTGDKSVGGLVGMNQKTIENCYAAGIVFGQDYVGGLVGQNNNEYVTNPIIKNSVAMNQYIFAPEDASYVGRVAGDNKGTIDYCHAWEGMKVKNEIVTYGTQNNVNGDNVSSVDVWADPDFYTGLGWDISEGDTTVWKINQDDGINYPLPYLKETRAIRAQVEYLKPTQPTPVPTAEQTKSPVGLVGLGLGLLWAAAVLRRK